MNEPIVKVSQLSHRYAQDWAIRDINFEINQTGILGLLGSNGAGKSTTMNIMCGVLNQTEGTVLINGTDIRMHPLEAKKKIGFLPQSAPLHLDLTVDEYLVYCAHIRLIPKAHIRAAVEGAKGKCGVAHYSKRLISNLSGGYKQRVGIAQAIIHQPKLVVLDEPTNGLDPNQILEVRSLIREIAEEKAVVFSTHILSEVQAICKDIIMIEHGQVVFRDTMDAFNNYQKPNAIVAMLQNPPAIAVLTIFPGVKQAKFLSAKEVRLEFDSEHDITEDFIKASIAEGWQLKAIAPEKYSLDDIFAKLSKNAINNRDKR